MPYLIYTIFICTVAIIIAAIAYEQKEARQYRAWVRAQKSKPKA